jgi:hypothetical protein
MDVESLAVSATTISRLPPQRVPTIAVYSANNRPPAEPRSSATSTPVICSVTLAHAALQSKILRFLQATIRPVTRYQTALAAKRFTTDGKVGDGLGGRVYASDRL